MTSKWNPIFQKGPSSDFILGLRKNLQTRPNPRSYLIMCHNEFQSGGYSRAGRRPNDGGLCPTWSHPQWFGSVNQENIFPLNGWPDIEVVGICFGNDRPPFEKSERDDIAFVWWLFSVTQYVATAVCQVTDLKVANCWFLDIRLCSKKMVR